MTKFLSDSSRIGSAAVMLLTLGLLSVGCSNRPDPRLSNAPPLNAAALSGGKITHFVPLFGLEHDSSNSILLAAVRLSNIKGSLAHSGLITFDSRTGHNSVSCLVIGNNSLVVVEDFMRQALGKGFPSAGPGSSVIVQGPPYNGKPFLQTKVGQLFIEPDSQQYIRINPNDTNALVGGKLVGLKQAVLWQDCKHPLGGDHVMLLSDLLHLWEERDKQRGSGQSVRNVKIIYDIREYHR
jgi:hypothetical protein